MEFIMATTSTPEIKEVKLPNFTEEYDVKPTKDSSNVKHVVCEFDLSELSQEDLNQYAYRGIVIQKQGKDRAHMTASEEKQETEGWKNYDYSKYKVPKPGTRIGAKSITEKATNLLDKMTPEQKAELFAIYQATLNK